MTETLSAADKIAVIGKAAKAASFQIANASTQQKNAVLLRGQPHHFSLISLLPQLTHMFVERLELQ